MPRGRWTPGPRRPAREKLAERYAWVNNYEGETVVFVQDPEKLFDENGAALTTYLQFGGGDNVHVTINPTKSRNSITLMLTNLNERELDELQQLLDLAFQWARPVVQLRDREAREALEAHGDDVNPRNYRQVPQFVIRRWPGGSDGEGVRVGSEDVSGVGSPAAGDQAGSGDDADGGAGSEESGMAGDPEEDRFSEDYEKAYHESPEPGFLGADPAGVSEVQSTDAPSIPTPPDPRAPVVPPVPPRSS